MGKVIAAFATFTMHFMTKAVAEIMNVALFESYAQAGCSGTLQYSAYQQADACLSWTQVQNVQYYKKTLCSNTGIASSRYADVACAPATKDIDFWAYDFNVFIFDHGEYVNVSPCKMMDCTKDNSGSITTCTEATMNSTTNSSSITAASTTGSTMTLSSTTQTTSTTITVETSKGDVNGVSVKWFLVVAIMTVIVASS